MTDQPSSLLVDQRIRNRVIEYLDLVSSFEAQLEYQSAVPQVSVPSEVIDQWEDWVHRDPREHEDYPVVCSPEEVEALRAFQSAWESAADNLPNPLPPLHECQTLKAWQGLRDAALVASAVFAVQGQQSDDEVVDPRSLS